MTESWWDSEGGGRGRKGQTWIWTWSKLPRTNSCSHCSYSKIPRAGKLADIDLKRNKEQQQLENSAAPFYCFMVFAIYTYRTYHLNNNKNNNNWKTRYAYDLPHAMTSPDPRIPVLRRKICVAKSSRGSLSQRKEVWWSIWITLLAWHVESAGEHRRRFLDTLGADWTGKAVIPCSAVQIHEDIREPSFDVVVTFLVAPVATRLFMGGRSKRLLRLSIDDGLLTCQNGLASRSVVDLRPFFANPNRSCTRWCLVIWVS